MLEPHRGRLTWDFPIHSVADVEALPFPPECLNSKPSRFGSVRNLFDFYDLCEAHAVRLTVPSGWEVVRHEGEFDAPAPSSDDLEALANAVREAASPQRRSPRESAAGRRPHSGGTTGRRGHLRVVADPD